MLYKLITFSGVRTHNLASQSSHAICTIDSMFFHRLYCICFLSVAHGNIVYLGYIYIYIWNIIYTSKASVQQPCCALSGKQSWFPPSFVIVSHCAQQPIKQKISVEVKHCLNVWQMVSQGNSSTSVLVAFSSISRTTSRFQPQLSVC